MPTSTTNILAILKQVEAHSISAEEGEKLLLPLINDSAELASNVMTNSARWLRVHITDINNGEERAQVNIPIGLVDISLRMGARLIPTLDEASYVELIDQAQLCPPGTLFEFFDNQNNEKIELLVE